MSDFILIFGVCFKIYCVKQKTKNFFSSILSLFFLLLFESQMHVYILWVCFIQCGILILKQIFSLYLRTKHLAFIMFFFCLFLNRVRLTWIFCNLQHTNKFHHHIINIIIVIYSRIFNSIKCKNHIITYSPHLKSFELKRKLLMLFFF